MTEILAVNEESEESDAVGLILEPLLEGIALHHAVKCGLIESDASVIPEDLLHVRVVPYLAEWQDSLLAAEHAELLVGEYWIIPCGETYSIIDDRAWLCQLI